MSPHDFRRIALAHELLAQPPSQGSGREEAPRDTPEQSEDRTPVISPARERAG